MGILFDPTRRLLQLACQENKNNTGAMRRTRSKQLEIITNDNRIFIWTVVCLRYGSPSVHCRQSVFAMQAMVSWLLILGIK